MCERSPNPRGWAMVALLVLITRGLFPPPPSPGPWLGLQLPPGPGDPHAPPVQIPEGLSPPPASGSEGAAPALQGERIRRDLERIIGFSIESREAGDRMWGRITGRPALQRTAEWVAQRFREIGLEEVEVQTYDSTEEMWWASDWEVRVIGNEIYGPGSGDILLESALPTSGSEVAGAIDAPLVHAGIVGEEPDPSVDVRGKAAVQLLRPERGAFSARGGTVAAAQALFERGAVAVINAIEQPGNMHVRDFGNCGGTCFNVGGGDAAFLMGLLERAAAAGLPEPRLHLALETETLTNLRGQNAVGKIRGDSDEIVIVNAHADGWFDAAGDNGDGLAVLIALAAFFAEPPNRPARTLVFVASGGHHSRGMNGPTHFVRMNPDIGERTRIVVNLEHVAQLALDTRSARFQPTEQPMSFGISNQAPYLIEVASRARERSGMRLNPTFPATVPGDLGGYAPLGVPRVQAIHAGPLYHTSGDVLETISIPGLERAARFFADFIAEVARAPGDALDP